MNKDNLCVGSIHVYVLIKSGVSVTISFKGPARGRLHSRSRFHSTQGGFECIPKGAVERLRAYATMERQSGRGGGVTDVSCYSF